MVKKISLKYGFCKKSLWKNETLTSCPLFSFFLSLLVGCNSKPNQKWKKKWNKGATGQSFIFSEVTSYKIHTIFSPDWNLKEWLQFYLILQAVINSTITPNMTFTKTSQKFGQWSDVRANTVYGLGFSSEVELNKVIKLQTIYLSRKVFLKIDNSNLQWSPVVLH